LSDGLVKVQLGERIAQGIISKVEQIKFTLTEQLTETKRDSGGFGSTGY
ncbi:MAG: dUTP diphosphatase, partial [Candidatus Fonsibacter ubiquis]